MYGTLENTLSAIRQAKAINAVKVGRLSLQGNL
jgi:hypothetical protein